MIILIGLLVIIIAILGHEVHYYRWAFKQQIIRNGLLEQELKNNSKGLIAPNTLI